MLMEWSGSTDTASSKYTATDPGVLFRFATPIASTVTSLRPFTCGCFERPFMCGCFGRSLTPYDPFVSGFFGQKGGGQCARSGVTGGAPPACAYLT